MASVVSALSDPLPLVFLHEVEVANAMHRASFEGLIAPEQCDAALEAFERDLGEGVYRRISIDIVTLTKWAIEISSTWSTKIGTRTLDVLHVAAAQIVGANCFLTGDVRQRRLASAVGLKTS